MKRVAALLDRLDVPLDLILTSPLPRAEQTAQAVAKKMKVGLREERALKPGFGLSELKRLVRKYSGKTLMIVGHEPDFSNTIDQLTGGNVKLSKAGIAIVEVDEEEMRGRLIWLFPPRLAKIATEN